MNNTLASLLLFVLALAVCLGIFLLFRGIVLWYWQIDKMVTNLRNIQESTEDLASDVAEMKDFLIHGVKKRTPSNDNLQ